MNEIRIDHEFRKDVDSDKCVRCDQIRDSKIIGGVCSNCKKNSTVLIPCNKYDLDVIHYRTIYLCPFCICNLAIIRYSAIMAERVLKNGNRTE